MSKQFIQFIENMSKQSGQVALCESIKQGYMACTEAMYNRAGQRVQSFDDYDAEQENNDVERLVSMTSHCARVVARELMAAARDSLRTCGMGNIPLESEKVVSVVKDVLGNLPLGNLNAACAKGKQLVRSRMAELCNDEHDYRHDNARQRQEYAKAKADEEMAKAYDGTF